MKTALITGANRGIGLALTREYLAMGWRVLAVCRTTSEDLAASGAEVLDAIDVKSDQDLTKLAAAVAGKAIDLVINNAGILRPDGLRNLVAQDITEQFLVNALAPLRVTQTLLSHLAPGAKVVFITSRMGSISDNTSGGYYGYRMSKAALNAGAMSLSHDLKPQGIAVGILHPGYVQTAMVNFGGDITAEVCAARLRQRIDGLNLANSGSFWHSNGEILPW